MIHKFEFLKIDVVLVYLCYVNVKKIELRNKNAKVKNITSCQVVVMLSGEFTLLFRNSIFFTFT